MLTGTLSAPDPAVGHSHPHTSTSCTLTGKSGSVIAPFSESWCAQGLVCALQESVSPVLCKFWRLYGEANDDLLQEGLCHTQVCCTQRPCPAGPLLIRTSTGDTQTQFWLSLSELGMHFVPFPDLSSSADQVLGKYTVLGGPCILVTLPVLAARFYRCPLRVLSQVCHVSPLES